MKLEKMTLAEHLCRAIFLTRFVMSLFYVGLVWVIIMLLMKFVGLMKDLTVATLFENAEKTSVIIGVLEVVDLVMVSQLVWMVTIAGFSLFVSSRYFDRREVHKPDWLIAVDTYGLKLKLAFSIIAISGIHALRIYLENHEMNQAVLYAVIVHFIFVLSAIGVSLSMKMGHNSKVEGLKEMC
jgi:uncharacterized protein (TIGR00645 family)